MASFLKRKQRKKKQGGIINNITDATYNVSKQDIIVYLR
jgi:hypothetical protein